MWLGGHGFARERSVRQLGEYRGDADTLHTALSSFGIDVGQVRWNSWSGKFLFSAPNSGWVWSAFGG